MSSFDEREEAFEKKFALEQEQRFKAEARQFRRLGLWAAGMLDKSGDAASAYAADVVAAAVSAEGRESAIRKLAVDLAPAGISELHVREKLEEMGSGSTGDSGG